MIDGEIYSTICPTCGSNCVIRERSDGNGGIMIDYAHDSRWLEDEEDALFLEQGSDVPNTSGSGGDGD